MIEEHQPRSAGRASGRSLLARVVPVDAEAERARNDDIADPTWPIDDVDGHRA